MKGVSIPYSEVELAFLRSHEKTPRRELTELFNTKFKRDISLTNINAKCKRMGLRTGRTGHYEKGQVSWNKGRKGWCPAGAEKGWFKKGNVAHNTKPIGSERVCSKDGYVLIKTDAINPNTGFNGRWIAKQIHLWEAINGPIPEGHFLKSLDGNRKNTDPSNWVCLPNGMKPRLVQSPAGQDYDGSHPQIKPTILATAKLAHRIHELKSGDAA